MIKLLKRLPAPFVCTQLRKQGKENSRKIIKVSEQYCKGERKQGAITVAAASC